jgi:hypothetical protein
MSKQTTLLVAGVVSSLLLGTALAGCQRTGLGPGNDPSEPGPVYERSGFTISCLEVALSADGAPPYTLEVGSELTLEVSSTNVCDEPLGLEYGAEPTQTQFLVLDADGRVVWDAPRSNLPYPSVPLRVTLAPGETMSWPNAGDTTGAGTHTPVIFTGLDNAGRPLAAGEYTLVGRLTVGQVEVEPPFEAPAETGTIDTEPQPLTLVR